jgi:sterol 24-C-methyltransferase
MHGALRLTVMLAVVNFVSASVDATAAANTQFVAPSAMAIKTTLAVILAGAFFSKTSSGKFKVMGVALAALCVFTYVPQWYGLTPGGRGGDNSLDTARQELLNRYDQFYENATEWDKPVQPAHDEANNKKAAERYFTLITDFFEYGWGDAFHMAPLKPGWSFARSMAEVEKHFGQLVGMKPGSKVADLGMGIGGPMRRLVEFTGAHISGVTICQYQVNRAKKITATLTKWMQERLSYQVGDYNDLPKSFEADTYDAAYFMESLSHAENRVPPLSQARKIVKPGHLVGAWQWTLKPAFNYSDPYHMDLKRGMEYGGGLRNLNKPHERHKEWNDAGLEILMSYDMGDDFIKRGWLGWWIAVTEGHDIPSMLTSSYYGRRLTMMTVKVLEWIGIAEKGTYRTALMLEHCGYSSAVSGEMGIFTPAWVTIGIVPPRGQKVKQGPIASGPEEFAKILDKHPYYLNVPGF